MPEEREKVQIISIHTKEDQQVYNAFKIMSTLIQRRIVKATANVLAQYQFEFTQGKSTIDEIQTVKQIIDKAHEYKTHKN